jgi:hypothetical protein
MPPAANRGLVVREVVFVPASLTRLDWPCRAATGETGPPP